MFHVPVTFLFDFEHLDENARPFMLHEFKSCGAENLVLTDTLIQYILEKPARMDRIQKEIADAGLKFVDSHAPFGNEIDLTCPVPVLRKQLILRHKLAIQIAAYLGVDTITIHIGNDMSWEGLSLEQAQDNVCQALAELLPTAREYGVTICIENVWFRACVPDSLLKIKARFPDDDALGFCYDSGHANILAKGLNFPEGYLCYDWKSAGLTPESDNHALEKMLPHVVNCHLHDNDGATDQHRLPGRGNIDWNHIIPLLKKAPRLKNIQSEVIPIRTNDSIPEIVQKFRELGELE